ncbi:hypothetical protein HPB47_002743 [Ixodes persulcatus]|uniref:Uncharacterized protein n=1 Tax=Ixodes persulcatus TaxID=34615 RepID=A0AC60PKR1_IXOPE|nr:hypothetical protein HPB47_002743 [Ixodes persulcatus]
MVQFQDAKGCTVLKPSVVCDYNHTMGGVQKSDQMLASYPVADKSHKIYYKKLFRPFLDDTELNAFILYKKNDGKMPHLKFRLSLLERFITKYHDSSQVRRPGRSLTSEMERLTGRHFPSYLPSTAKKQEPTRRLFKKLSHQEQKRVVEGFARAAMSSSYCSEEQRVQQTVKHHLVIVTLQRLLVPHACRTSPYHSSQHLPSVLKPPL